MAYGIKNYVVSYDVKLPNKRLLTIGITAGWTLIALGIAMLLIAGWQFFHSCYASTYGCYDQVYAEADGYYWHRMTPPYILPWYYGVAVVVVGIVIVAISRTTFYKFYREVEQGKIVRRDTTGGGFYFPVEWNVLVEGNTKANQLRRAWHTVSAGGWDDLKIGAFVDFR